MNEFEQDIFNLHNGQMPEHQRSEIVRRCWFANDFLMAYPLFLRSQKVTPVDFYVFLLVLNANNSARQSYELLKMAQGKENSSAETFLGLEGKNLGKLYRKLGVWGPVILLETESIMQVYSPDKLVQLVDQNNKKKSPGWEVMKAYLTRSLIYSRRTFSQGEVSYDELKKLFQESRALFEPFSRFEVMRTSLYEARLEGSIDRAKQLAEKAQQMAVDLGFLRYQTVCKEELLRRSTQLIIRDGGFTDHFDKLRHDIMQAKTLLDLFGRTARVLKTRIVGRPIRSFSFLEQIGNNFRVILSEEEKGQLADRQHTISSKYTLCVPSTSHWGLVEEVVKVVRMGLAGLTKQESGEESSLVAGDFVVFSRRMDAFVDRCREVIECPIRTIPVLITGETGTGKSWLAEKLHHLSPVTRSGGLQHWFAGENKAGDLNIYKTSLFGMRKGFTNTFKSDQLGKVELAELGSLIMDEIGELEMDRQDTLLQLLNNWKFERVGDPHTRQGNCRIFLATNRDLKGMVVNKTFREDLYFRINMYHIHIPPLRSYPEQILPLTRNFIAKHLTSFSSLMGNLGMRDIELSEEAKMALLEYSWPGNIRQLDHFTRLLVQGAIRNKKNLVDGQFIQLQFQRLQESDPFFTDQSLELLAPLPVPLPPRQLTEPPALPSPNDWVNSIFENGVAPIPDFLPLLFLLERRQRFLEKAKLLELGEGGIYAEPLEKNYLVFLYYLWYLVLEFRHQQVNLLSDQDFSWGRTIRRAVDGQVLMGNRVVSLLIEECQRRQVVSNEILEECQKAYARIMIHPGLDVLNRILKLKG